MEKEKNSFLELLKNEAPLVFDGSMVTALYKKGFYINRSFEEVCLIDPKSVCDVLESFKRAGSQILRTNTFNIHPMQLAKFNLKDQVGEIISSAVRINHKVAAHNILTAACIGPSGAFVDSTNIDSFEQELLQQVKEGYKKIVECFERCSGDSLSGVDLYSLDGFHSIEELKLVVQTIRDQSKKPIIAHMSVQENLRTSLGVNMKDLADLGVSEKIEVLGLSGDIGPSAMLKALQELKNLTEKPICILPTAGLPRYVNGQYIYMCSSDYIGKFSKRWIQSGASIIGGHSGVDDTHIKAIQNSVKMGRSLKDSFQNISVQTSSASLVDSLIPAVPLEKRSLLGQALKEKRKVVSVEIVSPKGITCDKFFEHCKNLQDSGVKFVNIPDGARAVARISSLPMAAYVKNNFKLEPIPHFTTRDRNLIGLQSDLLGAHINGVRNVLLVTGDPPKIGNCPRATAVYDVDAIGLTRMTARMNQGVDMSGSSFGSPTEFLIGVALNPTTTDQDLELKRFDLKIQAGADYAITQPIYDLEVYKKFMSQHKSLEIPVIMGIWPLVSLKNAEFLRNEVPGVSVPDWVIQEMQKAGDDKEEALKRGIEIAIKTMEKASSFVAGFQVSAPFNRTDVAIKAIELAGV